MKNLKHTHTSGLFTEYDLATTLADTVYIPHTHVTNLFTHNTAEYIKVKKTHNCQPFCNKHNIAVQCTFILQIGYV
jgi:hypothetical protein